MNTHESLIWEYYQMFKKQCDIINTLNKTVKRKIRKPNFPEVVSEALVKMITNAEIPKFGDLVKAKKKIEVKCFSSTGPTSFGPTENWDIIIFVDATKHPKLKFYTCEMSNVNPKWQSIKMNKAQTFLQQCESKRRPRISFSAIQAQGISFKMMLETDIFTVLSKKTNEILNFESKE